MPKQEPERKFFEAPGPGEGKTHRIGYLDWAATRDDAPVLLCMHGLTRNGRDFDFLARAMGGSFRVIAPDMAGRGTSSWLDDKQAYHYGTYLADTLALLAHLGIEKVHWVGTSMGGILGMTMAATFPHAVTCLALNDIGKFIPKEGLERIYSYAGEEHFFDSRREAEDYLDQIFEPFGITDPVHWKHMLKHSIWQIGEQFTLACDPDILLPLAEVTDNFTQAEDVDFSELWDKVSCPVLLLRGERSDILTKQTASEMARARNKQVTFIEFPGVGHAPALMDNEQITKVAGWLRWQR